MMEKVDSLTQEVAAFIVRTNYQDLPAEAIRIAKRCLIDGTGVILSGSTDQASVILRQYLESIGGKVESAVLGSKLRVPAPAAALANGTSGHAQDFDDTQLSTSSDRLTGLLTHPTTPVLAATFALGEVKGISGIEFLTAFSLGFEVECKMAEAIYPVHYKKGYHTTGTIGAFGAAVASGKILRLSEKQMRYALGIVASMSAGIRANFGTMTKPLHAGRAAENGVVAGHLAKLGFTSDPQVLENPWGFFKILGEGFDLDKISGKLGNPYTIVDPGISIKPYPSGVLSHPSMNAMLDLVKEHHLHPEDVAEIHLYAGSNILNPLRYALPQTALEGKFSLPFCLTSILLRQRAGLREFSDEFVKSPEVQEMMKRVKTILDPEIEAKGYAKILSRVEVRLKHGKTLKRESGPYKGGPENPLSQAELYEKFTTCAELALLPHQISQALELLNGIEKLQDIRILIPALLPD
ncbi:MAG: MmgE/PrpD family protein [Thermodesulfobacteriota bacterium]|nr:MmgE/PrpD family protein [Thermodesulfobacteriota bacterium]